jgi:hypothetical protein
MNITLKKKPVATEAKRLNLPFTVEDTCPKCGGTEIKDFSTTHHLDYPKIPGISEVYFSCSNDECYHEWERQVKISIVVEEA